MIEHKTVLPLLTNPKLEMAEFRCLTQLSSPLRRKLPTMTTRTVCATKARQKQSDGHQPL